MAFQRILVALDGSALAEQVLPYASDLSRRLRATLYLVSVVAEEGTTGGDTELTGAEAAAGGTPGAASVYPSVNPEFDGDVQRADQYLQGVALQLRSEGVEVSYELRRGSVVDEILAVADAHRADLIALASHGRSGIRRALFGSVADAVLRDSGRPVMVIKPKNEE